jgi:hypothetical protein
VVVQRILAMEEREAFTRAMATSGKHNSAGSTSGGQSGQSSLQRPAPGSQQSEGSGDEGGDASVLAALARLHHSSCYQQGLSQLLEAVVAPALSGLRCLLHQQHLAQAQLRHQNQLLQVGGWVGGWDTQVLGLLPVLSCPVLPQHPAHGFTSLLTTCTSLLTTCNPVMV